ncbi:MAG: hypothetical protein KF753_09725 [Caldilineaceae bacterium]|nr:hypothetical protein [Caldilineaceae bacterium]
MPPLSYRRLLLFLAGLPVIGLLLIGIPAQAQSGSIRYTAAWDWGNAIDTPGPGWEVTNNLGYRVQVESGAVVFYSAELLACAHEHSETLWQRLGNLLGESLAIPAAFAGHGDTDSPAEVMPIFVESVAEPVTTELGSVQVNEPAYCQGALSGGTRDRRGNGRTQFDRQWHCHQPGWGEQSLHH